MTIVRNLDHLVEADWLHTLWHRALSHQWSLTAADLKAKISRVKIALVAELNGSPVGFCAASYEPFGSAVLQVILVDPSRRRMGVGTALLEALGRILENHEVRSLSLGYEDSSEYFWPGVPGSQHNAWNFFKKHGWKPRDQNFDLLIDLATYHTPRWVTDRLNGSGATLHVASQDSAMSVVEFERRNFPKWAGFYENALRLQKYDNVLFAKAFNGAVIGTVLLNGNEQVPWKIDIGSRCGSIAVLGVAKEQEGKGIGTALAARSAEIVKQRGCSACYIGWTGLVTWYGKLGATIWSEYLTSTKQLLFQQEELASLLGEESRVSVELQPA